MLIVPKKPSIDVFWQEKVSCRRPRPFTEDEISCGCFAGSPNNKLLNRADYVGGNTAIIYAVAQNDIYAIFHELGHSFGLPHTFDKPPELDELKASKGHLDENRAKTIPSRFPTYQFYQGYTDNVMDYEGRNAPKNPSKPIKETDKYNQFKNGCSRPPKIPRNIRRTL